MQYPGEVAEWSNVPDSKSGVRFPRTVGSNPTLSAKILKEPRRRNSAGLFVLRLAIGYFEIDFVGSC
jgi:hypothetical protein